MAEIAFKRILKLHKDTWNNSKTIIQVVQWGNNKPSIEKRDYYKKGLLMPDYFIKKIIV